MRISAALIAAILAFALAACGDDSSSTPTQTSTAQSGGGETTSGGGEPSSQQEKSSGKGAGSSGGSNSGASGSDYVAAPLRVSGGGSTQFRSEGGDNSIQDFGEEGDGSELQEAAETVHDFYVARIAEEWGHACSYLSTIEVEQLEEFATQSPQLRGKGCAPILSALTQPLPASLQRDITTVDAGSLRHDGEQAFLIYFGADKAVYSMPMSQEDGEWKVSALGASALQ